MQSVESQPTFRRNISPPFSGSNKPSKIPAAPIWQRSSQAMCGYGKGEVRMLVRSGTIRKGELCNSCSSPDIGGNVSSRREV
jgi:hypothetical protein